MKNKIGVKEAAEILGVSKKTVYERLRSGKINAEKIDTKHGKKWVIDRDEIEETAKIEKDVIEVQEVKELIDKEQLKSDLINAIQARNKQDIDKAMDKVDDSIKRQNELLQEQQRMLEELQRQVDKTFIDKVKDNFNKLVKKLK